MKINIGDSFELDTLIATSVVAENKIKIGTSVRNYNNWYQDISIYPNDEFNTKLYRVLISHGIIKSFVSIVLKTEYDDKDNKDYGESKKYNVYSRIIESPTANNGSKSVLESFICSAEDNTPNYKDTFFVSVIGAPSKLMDEYFVKKFIMRVECDGITALNTSFAGQDMASAALSLLITVATNVTKAKVNVLDFVEPEVIAEPEPEVVEAEEVEPLDKEPNITPSNDVIEDAEFKEIADEEKDVVIDASDRFGASKEAVDIKDETDNL